MSTSIDLEGAQNIEHDQGEFEEEAATEDVDDREHREMIED
jgi:hypothetical protein